MINRKDLLAGLALASAGFVSTANAALTAGDIAIVGRINNGTPDTFSFVTLAPVAAGENVYFTDNGWTGTAFRSGSVTDGDGNEGLIKFTAAANVPAGSFFSSIDTGTAFTIDKSSAVPGGTAGSFADLALSTGGDQIYAFQGPDSLPLQNPSQQLYVFDDTNGFEDSTSSTTGSIPPGLTAGSTAVSFDQALAGTYRFDPSLTGLASGTKAQYLAAIANPANWVTTGELATSSTTPLTVVVPEPATLSLLGLGGLALLRRRRA